MRRLLDEAGFTNWAGGRTQGSDFENLVKFIGDLERQGKAYFSLNELPDSNLTDAVSREWVVASFLVSKGKAASVFMAGIQQYGMIQDDFPEYAAEMGAPLTPSPESPQANQWIREFESGVALVNAAGDGDGDGDALEFALNQTLYQWTDVYGSSVTDGVVSVPPLTGRILMRQTRRRLAP